ncbi:MAG: polysaccharide biosynthesis tyrosine autokinase [Armatimonadota bacterium]
MEFDERNYPAERYSPSALSTDRYHYRRSAGPDQVDAWRVWDILRRRWWLMLLIFGVVMALGVAYTTKQRPVYTATSLMVAPSGRSITDSDGNRNILNDLLSLAGSRSVAGMVRVMQSQDLISSVAQILGPDQLAQGFGSNAARTRSIPDWAINCSTEKDSDVISVTASAYDPEVAANLANTMVNTYINRDREYSGQSAKMGKELVYTELQSIHTQLTVAQRELATFKRSSRLVAAQDQLRELASNVAALQAQQDGAEVELAGARRQADILRAQLAAEGDEVQESRTVQINPEYQEALSNLAKLNAQRITMIQEYTPASPEIRNIDASIAATKEQMKKIARTVVSSTVNSRNPAIGTYVGSMVSSAAVEARLRALKQVITARSAQIAELPDKERVYTDLERKVRVLENTYQALSTKYYALLINEKSALPNVLVAATARPSLKPAYMGRTRAFVLFGLLGIVLAIAAAAIAERKDDRIKYEDTITNLTGEAPLTISPRIRRPRRSHLRLDYLEPDSPFVESFRTLRNIIHLSCNQPVKMLAVTSPVRNEGKSTTSVSLAIAMAMAGRKVLVIDCDMRRPVILHDHGSSPSDVGLAGLVQGLTSPEHAVRPTGIKNLFCLPCGLIPRNPAELLASPECRNVLKTLAKDYDAVVLDCPPCVGLSDMQVISTMVDGVLLVVAANQTLIPRLSAALANLEQVNAPYVGSVLNRMSLKRSRYSYDYGGDQVSEKDSRPRLVSMLAEEEAEQETIS